MHDIRKTLEESTEPAGIVVRGRDGALYFLTEEQADRARLANTALYAAFRAAAEPYGDRGDADVKSAAGPGQAAPRRVINCGFVKSWLDNHSPDSALWRSTCLTYFDNCA